MTSRSPEPGRAHIGRTIPEQNGAPATPKTCGEPQIEREDFAQLLSKDGFAEVVTVTREANGSLDTHTHSFEAKALILRGEIRLKVGDQAEQTYRVGDVFHLPAQAPHTERYGAQGVAYLVGRK